MSDIIIIHSKFSKSCKNLFTYLNNFPNLQYKLLNIDNNTIRSRVINDKRFQIKNVPCMLRVLQNQNIETYEGENLFKFITELVKSQTIQSPPQQQYPFQQSNQQQYPSHQSNQQQSNQQQYPPSQQSNQQQYPPQQQSNKQPIQKNIQQTISEEQEEPQYIPKKSKQKNVQFSKVEINKTDIDEINTEEEPELDIKTNPIEKPQSIRGIKKEGDDIIAKAKEFEKSREVYLNKNKMPPPIMKSPI